MKDREPVKYKRHTECRMIVVVGDWNGDSSFVIGAVEESTYEAFLEQGTWAEKRKEMYDRAEVDDIPEDTLRDVVVRAWMPYMWARPEVDAEWVKPEEQSDG